MTGTKAAAHYVLEVPAGGSRTIRLRLTTADGGDPFNGFDARFDSGSAKRTSSTRASRPRH